MNTQPIEKKVPPEQELIETHSVFHTIQGEGPFCGTPAIFVRLAGCNLQCPACDTDYTSERQPLTPSQLVQVVRDHAYGTPTTLVVITGGEPFRQNLQEFLRQLLSYGFYVQVETNGTLPPPEGFEYEKDIGHRFGIYIVCSPKAGKMNPEVEAAACCFKYVMDAQSVFYDGLPSRVLGHPAHPVTARPVRRNNRVIYLQPADHKSQLANEANVQACVKACMDFGYVLQLQTHKLIGVE